MRGLFLGALLLAANAVHAAPGELVSAELVVDRRGTATHTPMPLSRPADCAADARCLHASARDGEFSVELALGPGVRALPFEVSLAASGSTSVRSISVRLEFTADEIAPLGRDGQPVHASHGLWDRFDPKWIGLRVAHADIGALIFDDDVDSVLVAVHRDRVVVDVELYAAAARPFGHLPRCGQVWRQVRGRVSVADRWVHDGDRYAASGELLLGAALPVLLSPWPDGRAAAFVITDHADQTVAPTLHALLGGRDDADLDHPVAGLLGNQVTITKALFLRGVAKHGGARPQLEDPNVVELARRLHDAGSEVVPHSATPLTDSRSATEEALQWFGARGAHTLIDHQPQTNCEGFNQAGWHVNTGIADLLAANGYHDVWDLTEWTGAGLDERDPRHLDKRAPTIWPLGRLEPEGPRDLWMFRTTWAFIPTAQFFARYSAAALDRLEQDRGLHIAHTYLETLHPRSTFFGRRNVMLRTPDGRVHLDPRLEALFGALHRRVEQGTLWVPPLGTAAARLRALSSVRLRVTETGALELTRPAELDGVTALVEGPVASATADALAGQHAAPGGLSVWLQACKQAATPAARCTTQVSLLQADGAPRSLFR